MRDRQRIVLLIAVAATAIALMVGCQSTPTPAAPTTAPKAAAPTTAPKAAAPTTAPKAAAEAPKASAPATKAMKMGVVQMTQDIQVQVAMKEGIEEAAKKMGVELNIFDGMSKVERQISAMENMIASKVDAIILNPADAAGIIPAVEAANKAGIPIITFDTDAKGGKRDVFVESDNHRFGQLIGEYLVWKLNGKGTIGHIDFPFVTAVTDRNDSFFAVIKHFPDMKVVKTEIGANREAGLKAGENILQAHPDLTAFYAINDPGALGAYQAIKARGLDGKVVIATGDGDMESVKLIRDPSTSMKYNSAQFGKEIGRQALLAAYNSVLKQQIIKHVLIPVMPITIENSETYHGWENDVPEDLTPAWYNTPEWKQLSAQMK